MSKPTSTGSNIEHQQGEPDETESIPPESELNTDDAVPPTFYDVYMATLAIQAQNGEFDGDGLDLSADRDEAADVLLQNGAQYYVEIMRRTASAYAQIKSVDLDDLDEPLDHPENYFHGGVFIDRALTSAPKATRTQLSLVQGDECIPIFAQNEKPILWPLSPEMNQEALSKTADRPRFLPCGWRAQSGGAQLLPEIFAQEITLILFSGKATFAIATPSGSPTLDLRASQNRVALTRVRADHQSTLTWLPAIEIVYASDDAAGLAIITGNKGVPFSLDKYGLMTFPAMPETIEVESVRRKFYEQFASQPGYFFSKYNVLRQGPIDRAAFFKKPPGHYHTTACELGNIELFDEHVAQINLRTAASQFLRIVDFGHSSTGEVSVAHHDGCELLFPINGEFNVYLADPALLHLGDDFSRNVIPHGDDGAWHRGAYKATRLRAGAHRDLLPDTAVIQSKKIMHGFSSRTPDSRALYIGASISGECAEWLEFYDVAASTMRRG